MKYILSLFLIGLLTFNSCFYNSSNSSTSYEQKMKQQEEEILKALESWIGSHKSELIRSWGAPDRYADDGDNGEILIWESQYIINIPYNNNIIRKVITYKKQMYVDEYGKIYNGRYQRY